MLVKILLAAAVISAFLAIVDLYNGEGDYHAFVEPFIIMLILVLNAIVGVWQESSAEAAIEALKEYEAPEAVVVRESVIRQIPAVEVVPGDILLVSVGNMVPADSRVLQLVSTTVRVDQSALTGEAVSVLKSEDVVKQERIELQGKTNTIFSGTMITYGKVKALAVATGKDTEIGKIQDKIQNSEEVETPLQKKLDEFADVLSKIIAIICVVVWAVNINHFTDKNFGSWYKGAIYYFKIAVSLAVAAIPEGLPSVVTICLALGTRRMAKKNAIVKSLPSVETLGCTSVICSDKTGTLTQNSMSIIKMFTVSSQKQVHLYHVEDSKWRPQGKITDNGKTVELPASIPAFAKLAAISALANDSNLTVDGEKIKVVGEPTEAAMRVLVEKIGVSDSKQNTEASNKPLADRVMYVNHLLEKQYQKISTLEFTRARKSMSAIARSADKKLTLFCKGAPECILERCEKVLLEDGGIVDLDKTIRERILSQTKALSEAEALRCIGVAYKAIDESVLSKPELKDPNQFDTIESGMIFVGVVGMLDPPRPEVKEAVEKCKSAGIRVIVITGDNKNTAAAICKQIGIFDEKENIDGLAYTGQEFDNLSTEKKKEAVLKARLFSRVEPSHKMEIVQMLQEHHDIVAMTGDGVNDSPALKQADIGIGMGSGTNVAKNASKMVLQDDNFSTIVKAIEEGRGIYNNTKQFIRYLISSNIGEVVAIFLTAALGMPEALVPVQLLFVNLVTDGLPSIALSFNPVERDVMKRKPRDARAPIIDRWLFIRYMVIGTYVGFATVAGFAWWFMFYSQGPHITFYDLTHFHSCLDDGSHSYSCSIFADSLHASTMSLTILVVIEMFNAMNAISENESIFVFPPFKNIYLILAIISSMALHLVILYVPFVADIFGVAPLNLEEWTAVILLSLPVIFIDEVLKLISRTIVRK